MITEEQIHDWAEESTQEGITGPKHRAFIDGFNKAVEQMEIKWIPLPAKELLPTGHYLVKVYQPITKIEAILYEYLHTGHHILNYAYGIEYMRINLPEPLKS